MSTCIHAYVPWQPLFLQLCLQVPQHFTHPGGGAWLDSSGTSGVCPDPSLPGSQPKGRPFWPACAVSFGSLRKKKQWAGSSWLCARGPALSSPWQTDTASSSHRLRHHPCVHSHLLCMTEGEEAGIHWQWAHVISFLTGFDSDKFQQEGHSSWQAVHV